jgi:hypothetical protein
MGICEIAVDGCKGAFTGAFRFRKPAIVRKTMIATSSTTASVASLLPFLGFPASIAATKMRKLSQRD